MATIKAGDNGNVANVDAKKRLATFATTQDLAQSLNQDGKVFSLFFAVTPVSTNDFFFHFENTGTSDLAIGIVAVSSTVATRITYEFVSGTPTFVSATDAAVTNLNLGNSAPLPASAQFDTDITGLTSEGILDFQECSIVDTKFITDFQSGILIPQGKAVAFKRVAATGLLTVTVGVVIVEL